MGCSVAPVDAGWAVTVSAAAASEPEAVAAAAQPTVGDTWVFLTDESVPLPGELGIGPIVGTVRVGEDHELLSELLAARLGSVRSRGYGVQWYGQAADVGDNKSLLAWEPRSSLSPADECYVVVTQSDCDALGLVGSIQLLGELLEAGLRVSRLDGRRDDREGLTDPMVAHRAFFEGQVRTRVRRGDGAGCAEHCGPGMHRPRGHVGAGAALHLDYKRGGETVYIGSRSSTRLLRIYDASALHGEGCGTRWELESHAERAQQFAQEIVTAGADGFAEALMGLIRQHVDFVARDQADARGDRSVLLGWWAAFVDGAKRATAGLPMRRSEIAEKLRWVMRVVAPTLALCATYAAGHGSVDARRAAGLSYLRKLAREGSKKLREKPDRLRVLPVDLRGYALGAVR
jgi:hypothetical protein